MRPVGQELRTPGYQIYPENHITDFRESQKHLYIGSALLCVVYGVCVVTSVAEELGSGDHQNRSRAPQSTLSPRWEPEIREKFLPEPEVDPRSCGYRLAPVTEIAAHGMRVWFELCIAPVLRARRWLLWGNQYDGRTGWERVRVRVCVQFRYRDCILRLQVPVLAGLVLVGERIAGDSRGKCVN